MSSQTAPTDTPQTQRTETPTASTPAEEADERESHSAEPLSLDLVFEVLKNERRRRVLKYLADRQETVSLSDLAEHIAAIENDKTEVALSSQERKRVYVGLYQCHLPKMDDTNVIDFNGDRGTVALGENAEQLYPFLDTDDEQQQPWPKYYLGHTTLSLALFAAALVAAPAALSAVFGLSLLGFVLLGTAHHSLD